MKRNGDADFGKTRPAKKIVHESTNYCVADGKGQKTRVELESFDQNYE